MFSHISIEARMLLALILDRHNLSEINSERFTDKNGAVYVVYTIDEVCRKFGCSATKTNRIFKELENKNMITRNRKNRLSPYRIFLTDTFYEFMKCENTYRELTTSQNKTSRDNVLKSHEITNRTVSNNKSNNEYSNNHSSITGFEKTEDEIKEQIEYDCIVCDANRNLLDEMVMIIFDILNGTSETVRVGKDEMPRGAVIARFCKINSEHIFYIFSKLSRNETEIKNIKPYLITMLYNAPATIEADVTAEFAYHQKIS